MTNQRSCGACKCLCDPVDRFEQQTCLCSRLQVTQSRHAVDVSDAVGLVKQLEGLTGAVDYEEAIARHSTGLEHLAASMEETKAQIDRWGYAYGLTLCWTGQATETL